MLVNRWDDNGVIGKCYIEHAPSYTIKKESKSKSIVALGRLTNYFNVSFCGLESIYSDTWSVISKI